MAQVALKFLIGRKRGMTQRFTEDGRVVPLTVVEAGPCTVTQIRSAEKDGYAAIQVGFEECRPKVLSRPVLGHLGVIKSESAKADGDAKAGKALRVLREARIKDMPTATVGDVATVAAFEKGELIDVEGISKGRGFMGTIRAHHFNRGPASHGSMNIRQPGSVGSSADPSHTFRGTRMALHLGAKKHTAKNLQVFDVDPNSNLIYIYGAVAGPTGGLVVVKRAKTPPPPRKAPPTVKKASQKGGPEKAKK